MWAWLPRACRARQCAALGDGKTEESALPIHIPHRGPQALVGPVVGAERIPMHDQHGFAVQGHDEGIRQELSARSGAEGLSEKEIPIAVHDEARYPVGRQRSDGIQRLGLSGIRRIVAHPGFE